MTRNLASERAQFLIHVNDVVLRAIMFISGE